MVGIVAGLKQERAVKHAYIATIDVNPEDLDTLMAALLSHRERSLANEPGTLQFEIMRPSNGDGQIGLFQIYSDRAAFDAHQSGESIAQVRRETQGIQLILHVSHFDVMT